jgi:transketolase
MPILYRNDEVFRIGGSKTLRAGKTDSVAIIAAGITVHEAISAYDELKAGGILVRVIDLYSIKPLDHAALRQAADETGIIITVEDHYAEGGIGEAVAGALASHPAPVISLAVRKMPRSGKTGELLDFEEISKQAIVNKVKEVVRSRGK